MAMQDPHSFSDTRQGRIRHIDVDFDVDFPNKTLHAKVDYTLEAPASGPLYLDVRGVQIKKIHANGKVLPWKIDEEDRIKGQRLNIDNTDAHQKFTIEYDTAPNASALGWLDPKLTAGGEYPFLLSQCQAIHARSMLPCQDSPSVRFTYTAKVTVPAPLIAAMSASEPKTERVGDKNVCTFEMPQAIPSYLFALAVGNLAFRKIGPRSGVFADPTIIDAAAWEFAETERLIDEAEKLFGPYLWETFNMLILPPSFPYGGMENPRLAFLTPTLIVGDRSMVNVVAHELAHSWTGNLVTNATWQDFWLNEGWTVLAERRILEVLSGEAYAQLHNAVRRGGLLEDMRNFGEDSDPTKLWFDQRGVDPDEVFSMVPYEKGCAFLTLVEEKVGRKRFDKFIRDYIETFKFQSITTEEFLKFLREHLPEVDEEIDIQKWVYGPGLPDDAPVPTSPLLDDVFERINDYKTGKKPTKAQVAGWKPQQIEVFFRNLPPSIPVEDCAYFEDLFSLKNSRNYTLLTEYFVVAIRSGCEQVLERAEKLLSSVGRMLYLRPLYRVLATTPWSRSKARELFEKYRDHYHPIAQNAVERLLENAGL